MHHTSCLAAVTGLCLFTLNGCHGGSGAMARAAREGVASQHAALGVLSSASHESELHATTNVGRADRLSVLTFNMQHRNNPEQLSVMANRLDADLDETPDFILCQEVLFERSRDPEQANTAAVLANDLGCYWRGTKRTSDREGLAIISRYPFEYYAERHLKSQTSRLLLGFRRVSVMGEFQVPEVGRVRVVNVHFTNWGFESHVRRKQLEETLEWMIERDNEVHADVVILGGDFNIKCNSDELKLVTEGKYAQIFNFQNFNTTAPTRGSAGRPNVRIDYVFVSSPKRELTMGNGGEQRLWVDGLSTPQRNSKFWISDHVPVLHEYAMPAPAAVAAHVAGPSNAAALAQ